jgi:hypothetical protein
VVWLVGEIISHGTKKKEKWIASTHHQHGRIRIRATPGVDQEYERCERGFAGFLDRYTGVRVQFR